MRRLTLANGVCPVFPFRNKHPVPEMVMDGRNDLFCFFARNNGRRQVNADHELCFCRKILDGVHNIVFRLRIDLFLVKRCGIKGVEETG